MVNKKIIIGIVVILILTISLVVGLGRQGFYMVASECQTQSGANTIADWQEDREGFCSGFCYVKENSQCKSIYGTGKIYMTYCDSGNPNNIAWGDRFCNEQPDECKSNHDCDEDESCQYVLGIHKCKEITCPTFAVARNHECVWIGCRSEGCPSGQYCDWDTNTCEDASRDPKQEYDGKLEGVTTKKEIAKGEKINIQAYFTPTISGTYYFSAGISIITPFKPLTVYAKGEKEASREQYVNKGQPEKLDFQLTGTNEVGLYTIEILVNSPNDDLIAKESVEIKVGEQNLIIINGNVIISGESLCDKKGETIKEDCDDGSTVTAFICSDSGCDNGIDLCWKFEESCPIIDKDGTGGGSTSCKAYKKLTTEGCKFSLTKLFTKSGISEMWDNFMLYIIGVGLGIIIIIVLIIYLRKKQPLGL